MPRSIVWRKKDLRKNRRREMRIKNMEGKKEVRERKGRVRK